MPSKTPKQQYLLDLYEKIADYFSTDDINRDELPDIIVSFCIVVEKILKIKLHAKNPLLVFDYKCFKEDNVCSIIALEKEDSVNTLYIQNLLNRFKVVFEKVFTESELQALMDIYYIRNSFVHSYKSDDKIISSEEAAEDIVTKMSTIWKKIPEIATQILGRKYVLGKKLKKKYTEEDLEKVLEKEVEKMIAPVGANNVLADMNYFDPVTESEIEPFIYEDRCPRCGSASFSHQPDYNYFSVNDYIPDTLTASFVDSDSKLYKCAKCNLELTEKQYEIAKKIKRKLVY